MIFTPTFDFPLETISSRPTYLDPIPTPRPPPPPALPSYTSTPINPPPPAYTGQDTSAPSQAQQDTTPTAPLSVAATGEAQTAIPRTTPKPGVSTQLEAVSPRELEAGRTGTTMPEAWRKALVFLTFVIIMVLVGGALYGVVEILLL
ncbi:hypothetical protein COCSADRAFT_156673 [Bipolaris sorokiniana ND90Pr]|uniref:Uncharacterized protein n=1 Tax=Cochliobolus sativus (strain ND90Pr / ATCC 201652) TaxID=665912 RepID=M2T113_COCSN|nr:uncharacterized protein COCSADRAFT_156673 [Bipolaris sorokiniana ND90Pr]EMD68220.1 hypothetical protein COCSADRAFT_156673 [Bipolaris sorokiniana ND90Pr]